MVTQEKSLSSNFRSCPFRLGKLVFEPKLCYSRRLCGMENVPRGTFSGLREYRPRVLRGLRL